MLALTQILLREMLMSFLLMQALQALFSYCRDMRASSKAEVCFLAMVLGTCGLEKIRGFQVISALRLLLPLTYSVDLDRSLHIYWN